MRTYVGLATAAFLLVAISCDEPTRTHGGPIHMLQAYATTVQNDTQSYCGITTSLPSQLLGLPPWMGRTTAGLSRWVATTQGVIASRDTTVVVSFSVTQDSQQLVFVFGAPLNDTLIGSVVRASTDPTSGTWTCPATLPFADNALLLSRGYKAEPAPSGTWELGWFRPID